MVTFDFATMISEKNPEGKKQDFCRFSMTFCFDLVQIQKVILCKKRFLRLFRISQFEGHSIIPNALADS